ncbi:MAG: hypothetical protein KatS3mg091_686 [Patescibacteria group bacterium]|nr:MAG: hypothetical protein KatS3mg091_686 [Patescibacteria group bacterium]
MPKELENFLKETEKILWVGTPEAYPFTARRYLQVWVLLVLLAIINIFFYIVSFYFYKYYLSNLSASIAYFTILLMFFCSFLYLSYITFYILAKPVVSAFSTRYYLTDQKLILEYGFIKKGFKFIDLNQITNVIYKQTIFDKIYKTYSADVYVNYKKNSGDSGLFLIENIFGYKDVVLLIKKAKDKNLGDFL